MNGVVLITCMDQELDEAAVAEFRSKLVEDGMAEYTEEVVGGNIVEGVLAIGRSGDQDLIVVGKGRFPSNMVAELADRQAEHAELGPVADIPTSSGNGVVSSVLVIQQHDVAHVVEAPVSKIVRCDESESSPPNINPTVCRPDNISKEFV